MLQTAALGFDVDDLEGRVALEAVAKLFQALHQHGVRYCHWKSNLRLDHGLRGRTDLDLLVDRTHGAALRRILHQQNIKPVLAAPGKRYPAVEDYLGYDRASGKLFHLHIHYQLVLGEQFVKNYRLPLEDHFLDSVRLRHGVNIPSPELEITVLALRALLKYRDRDAIKDILGIRSSGLPQHILAEIKHLLAQTSPARVAETLVQVANVVPSDVVQELLDTVVRTPRSGYTLYRLRARVRRALHVYQRHNRLQAKLTYIRELWRRRRSFLRFAPERKMTPASGGLTLALIGVDGAGKSTMVELLAKWLSWKMDVQIYYLGSKQPSRRSEWLYTLFRMARRSGRATGGSLGEQNMLSRSIGRLRDSLLYTHHLSIGWDRYRRYRAGKKRALSGSVVIYDRYPLESLSTRMEHRLLDGPQIPELVGDQPDLVGRMFVRAEQQLYLKMRLPDCLCVLSVSPDVSLQRKPDHARSTVEAKSRAVSKLVALAELDAAKAHLTEVNADLPSEEVLRQLKTKLWELL